MTRLSPDELAVIDDILNNSVDIEKQEPTLIPGMPLIQNAKSNLLNISTKNLSNSKFYQSRVSLSPQPLHQLSSASKKVNIPEITAKCATVYVGGPNLQAGMTRNMSEPRFCSNLICVSCDHKVIRFPNYHWNAETDYLFLRNNYPDTVQKNLVPFPGSCAYCCQCTHMDEMSLRRLDSFSCTWACRGHH